MHIDALIGIIAVLSGAVASTLTITIKALANAKEGRENIENVVLMTEQMGRDVDKLLKRSEAFQRKGWETLPEDIATSSGLTAIIREMQRDIEALESDVQELQLLLRDK